MLGSTKDYDYIVVGAGSAGCVVAARLAEDPDIDVLLLESGPADSHPAIAQPPAWPTLWGSDVDHRYRTVPQPGTDGLSHSWPRGRTLGGSSSINAMVYLRGQQRSIGAAQARVPPGGCLHPPKIRQYGRVIPSRAAIVGPTVEIVRVPAQVHHGIDAAAAAKSAPAWPAVG